MKQPPAALREGPDEAILRLARALALQAAREDHEAALAAARDRPYEARGDLRKILD